MRERTGAGRAGSTSRGVLRVLALIGGMAAVGFAAAYGVARLGVYDVSATSQHTGPVFALLDTGMRSGVRRRARGVRVPELNDAALSDRGFRCYTEHCEQCHGAPGVARAPFARGMLPTPHDLSQAASEWSPAELYWVIRHGLKMTGMPAWGHRLPESELWALVAFLQQLPQHNRASYAALRVRVADIECARR